MSQSMASTPKALFLKNNLKFNTPSKLTSLPKIIIKKLEISKNDFTDDDVIEKVCQNFLQRNFLITIIKLIWCCFNLFLFQIYINYFNLCLKYIIDILLLSALNLYIKQDRINN